MSFYNMERFSNAHVICTLVILIPSIHSKSHVCTMNGDFTIPKKVVYENHIPAQKEMESAISPKIRVKRQDTGGKYEEASEMGILKIIQVIVQMMRNIYVGNPTGGSTPWHESVPKPVVLLFKDKLGTILVKKKSKEQEEDEKNASG